MKRTDARPQPITPHDYERARQEAVSWLGDRYLLAAPVTRRPDAYRPYFNEMRRWHGAPPPQLRLRH